MNPKFSEWFYSLAIWDEIDNYIYFAVAGLLLWVLPFPAETVTGIGGALIGALILKGRGAAQK